MLSRKFKEIAAAAASSELLMMMMNLHIKYHPCRHLIRDTFRKFGVKFMHKWFADGKFFGVEIWLYILCVICVLSHKSHTRFVSNSRAPMSKWKFLSSNGLVGHLTAVKIRHFNRTKLHLHRTWTIFIKRKVTININGKYFH